MSAFSAEVTRVVLVGDVHDQWYRNDEDAVRALQPDITIFLGDIGNEAVQLTREISEMDLPKAVILGNHDAFFTPEPMVRKDLTPDSAVDPANAQMDILGEDHVGFSTKQVPNKPVTVVGARPFAGGGIEKHPKIIQNLYGYKPSEYAKIIANNARGVPKDHALIIVGHNGPTELGDKRHDICGVDFRHEEGDHGDKDLRQALNILKDCNRSPALVAFGHMHHRLNDRLGGGFRRRVLFDDEEDTVYLNFAVVPRIRSLHFQGKKSKGRVTWRHFGVVEIQHGKVMEASDVWLSNESADKTWSEKKTVLFKRTINESSEEIEIYNTHISKKERTSVLRLRNDYAIDSV